MIPKNLVWLADVLAVLILTIGSPVAAWSWPWMPAGNLGADALLEASDGYIYASGNFGHQGVFRTNDGGATWTSAGNPGPPDVTALLEASDGYIYAATWNGYVFRTNDGGANWTNTGDLNQAKRVRCLLEAEDGYIYAGGLGDPPETTVDDGVVWRTNDDGATWNPTGDLSVDEVYSLLEASDGYIYAGTADIGIVRRTNDGGATWTSAGNPGPHNVNALLEASDGYIYAGTSYIGGGVSRTNDGGATWSSRTGGNTYSLLEASDGYIYAGRFNGVSRTDDGGATWTNTHLPLAEFDLFVNELLEASDGYIYAGGGRIHKRSSAPTSCIDNDGDGYGEPGDPSCFVGSETDCDDTKRQTNPGRDETCDGLDNNCDGDLPSEEADEDEDGYMVCENDCNDSDANINPGMTEIPGNGLDDDCDPATPAYPQPANTVAASYGRTSLIGSGVFNSLALLLIPVGWVILLRRLRRK